MPQEDPPLRRGWTTGACATAAAKAAYAALRHGAFPDPVSITLPRGERPPSPWPIFLSVRRRGERRVVKDAGTTGCHPWRADPRHGAGCRRAPAWCSRPGGVGTVTLPGLPLPPGEPAINPVPRAMIRAALAEVAGAEADAHVEISIPGGEALARKTMNPRLGILGGLSVLGTTGVVVPYSCAAWIHSIHRGWMWRGRRLRHVAGATGSTSEDAVRRLQVAGAGADRHG
ncbi:cobalt-precorrin-5B (C(1))-methyltransferase CbiD [Pseudoroseomonas cervicalis]|uniref:cobalt-precorrin-5B (C(1))-methyltransferase CbiD n=1 Tax=Teichococcus cervicalis TaxID=204525 RepID=UPI0035E6CC13